MHKLAGIVAFAATAWGSQEFEMEDDLTLLGQEIEDDLETYDTMREADDDAILDEAQTSMKSRYRGSAYRSYRGRAYDGPQRRTYVKKYYHGGQYGPARASGWNIPKIQIPNPWNAGWLAERCPWVKFQMMDLKKFGKVPKWWLLKQTDNLFHESATRECTWLSVKELKHGNVYSNWGFAFRNDFVEPYISLRNSHLTTISSYKGTTSPWNDTWKGSPHGSWGRHNGNIHLAEVQGYGSWYEQASNYVQKTLDPTEQFNLIATDYDTYAVFYSCEGAKVYGENTERLWIYSSEKLNLKDADDQNKFMKIKKTVKAKLYQVLPTYQTDQLLQNLQKDIYNSGQGQHNDIKCWQGQ